ncbi:MAG: GtrA family protein [Actinobacteria bacterium HGW-Actinobacteria-4]|nr:MAG: GtrA family protein [Actinobacteria bacterium HGW-Actinobacteria-4]
MSIIQWFRDRAQELGKFGTVGVAGVFVDAGTFNLLLLGPLAAESKVITAKVIATGVAIVFAWVSHRLWTFSDRRSLHPVREFLIFGAVNGIALVIQAGVLAISHYVLGFTSPLADNIAAYAVGLPLGTIARYAGYRMFVFTGVTASEPVREEPPT